MSNEWKGKYLRAEGSPSPVCTALLGPFRRIQAGAGQVEGRIGGGIVQPVRGDGSLSCHASREFIDEPVLRPYNAHATQRWRVL